MPAKQGEHCESTARDTLIDGQRSAFEKGTRFCLHGSVTRAYIPQVLNIDVSKLVPTRFFDYVAPLFPGLFFEISVLIANPNLIRQFLANTAQVLGGSHYLPVAIGLFIAFAVGFGALMFVSLLAWFLTVLVRRPLTFLWKRCCALIFLPLLNRFVKGKPVRMKHTSVQTLLRYLQGKAFPPVVSEEFDRIRRCWIALARELLTKRYGPEAVHAIGPAQGEDWSVLYWTLASPKREELQANLTMNAAEASGWCGLAAAYFAPALVNKAYFGFCGLLVVNGLIFRYYDSKRRTTPEGRGYMNIRALLREFNRKEESKED